MAELTKWEELLTFETFSDYTEQYGPHTQAVVNCFATLDTVSWFTHVGADHIGRDEARVDTWSDAVEPLMQKGGGYDKYGQLAGPSKIMDDLRDKRGYKKFQKAALTKVMDYADFGPYIPTYFEKPEVEFMTRHLSKYLENLVIEIICADEHECAFYRQQLTWFEAGHFPCGWMGEWPNGDLRVF